MTDIAGIICHTEVRYRREEHVESLSSTFLPSILRSFAPLQWSVLVVDNERSYKKAKQLRNDKESIFCRSLAYLCALMMVNRNIFTTILRVLVPLKERCRSIISCGRLRKHGRLLCMS